MNASERELMTMTLSTNAPTATMRIPASHDSVLLWSRRPRRAAVATATAIADDILAVSSLERAVSGEASVGDVGALAWMMLRGLAPCEAMAIFIYDDVRDELVVRYAAGLHAESLRRHHVRGPVGLEGVGPATHLPTIEAELASDPDGAATLDPPLLSAFAVPLQYDDCLVGVLTLYATAPDAFTGEHQRLVELVAPSLAVSVASVAEVVGPPVAPSPQPRKPPTHLRLVHRR